MKGCAAHQLASYLDEFMWRERHGKTAGEALRNVMRDIVTQYPVWRKEKGTFTLNWEHTCVSVVTFEGFFLSYKHVRALSLALSIFIYRHIHIGVFTYRQCIQLSVADLALGSCWTTLSLWMTAYLDSSNRTVFMDDLVLGQLDVFG